MKKLTTQQLKLYEFLLDNGPLDQHQIQEKTKLSDVDLEESINGLLESNRVEIEKNHSGEIRFAAIPESEIANAETISDLAHDESLVYQAVAAAKDLGIWMGTIRSRTSLPPAKVKKILKTLEGKKLVKSFKEFGSKTKVLYILYEIQPNKKFNGGVFVDPSTNEYDISFIETVKLFFELKINKKGHATVEELKDAYVSELRSTGQSQVDLELPDIQRVLNLLVFDGKVEPISTVDDYRRKIIVYKPAFLSLPQLVLSEIPCTRCPVATECSEFGDVTPEKCIYLNKWLDF